MGRGQVQASVASGAGPLGGTMNPWLLDRGVKRRCWLGTAGGLLLVGAALAGCSVEPAGQAQAARPQTIPVSASPAIQKAVPVQLTANGTAQAYSTVSIMSQVDGQIAQVHFTEGQDVKKGDLLFTLDQQPFEAALRQAQGILARDRAQLLQAQANLAQTRAAEQQAEANLARDMAQLDNANVEVRRYQELITDGAISKEQFDAVRTTATAAGATVQADRAAVTNAQAVIQAAEATLENAKAGIEADQAAVENARIQLGYTLIRAPMDGRTASLLLHPGSTVKARDAGSVMVVINQIHPIYVAFSVPEQYLAEVRKYRDVGTLRVEAVIPGQEDRPIDGKLTFVNNTVDPTTGTILLKADFANPDNRLWPGQFLNVLLILTTEPNAVLVPSQALQTGQQGPFLFVVKPDHTVEARPVVAGQVLDNLTVIQKGLAPGEMVVTDGQIRLAPGVRVEVRPAAPAAAAREIAG
jgi:membrane fusion protein, multidrug efflux system